MEPSLSLPLPPVNKKSATTATASNAQNFDGDGADVLNDQQFALTPLLGLPPAFGSTYVGETFACTLCANNELRDAAADRREEGTVVEAEVEAASRREAENGRAEPRSVTGVRMSAEMQTPSNPGGIPLKLRAASLTSSAATGDALDESGGMAESAQEQDAPVDLGPGENLQRTVHYELREQGTHYLAITITYNEHQREEGGGGRIVGARVRSFRKLYQFVAQTLLGVRTKAGEVAPVRSTVRKGEVAEGRKEPKKFALEAQIENFGDVAVVLEVCQLHYQTYVRNLQINLLTCGERLPKLIQNLHFDLDP